MKIIDRNGSRDSVVNTTTTWQRNSQLSVNWSGMNAKYSFTRTGLLSGTTILALAPNDLSKLRSNSHFVEPLRLRGGIPTGGAKSITWLRDEVVARFHTSNICSTEMDAQRKAALAKRRSDVLQWKHPYLLVDSLCRRTKSRHLWRTISKG